MTDTDFVHKGSFVSFFAVILILTSAGSSNAYEQELQTLSESMAKQIQSAQKKTVAVVDFWDLQGNVTELGRFLAEEFSVALADAEGGFEVVDRTHLASLLKEHKLSRTGLIDPETARELGKITGVEALITGTITPFGESVRIAVKILDADTARIIGSNGGNIAKTDAIKELLRRGVSSRTPAAPGTPTRMSPETQIVAESGMIEVKLVRCERWNRTVTFHLLVTNKGDDKSESLRGDTRMFDDQGNEYRIVRGRLGNSAKDFSGRGVYYQYIRKEIVSDVPIQMEATFEGLSPHAIEITLLEIISFDVQLRNIPLEGCQSNG